jgi:glycosyltransferase 2 family protein
MKKLYRIVAKVIPWVVVLAVAVFFYRTLSDNLHKLEGISLGFDVWALLGIIAFTLAVVVSGLLWGNLLSKLAGREVYTADAVRIHAASWLLKYVPGQVGSYLNKLAWGTKQGISKKTVSTSFIYENVLMVVAGITLSFPIVLIFNDAFKGNLSLFVPVLMIIPMVIVFSRKIFYTLLNKAFLFVGKKPFQKSDFLTGFELIRYQLGYFIPRLLNGVGFIFIVQSMLPVSAPMYVGLASIYILASIVGLLAVFVPGGLGVREAVIVAFLSVYFPVEQAIIVALVTRLYATISDAGVALVYLILNKGKIKQL